MADETDFLDLYGKLRLEPNCTLADFKQAYRRHVAAWHPDRRRGSRADALAAARLQRLTAQYSAAMEFHRRHGRLPGAVSSPRVSVVAASAESVAYLESDAPAAPSSVSFEGAERFEDTPLRGWRTRWLWLAALVIVAVVAWSLIPAAGSEEDDASTDTSVTMASTP
ncbi:hypothetical protein C8J98_10234 [Luteibacter sp. OK325]|uniref:J domain-containing protein n=1 Tax=Luteibacter sp. OK325 TaxID=2135670 RepID=UPI000D34343F|nr:J domain-containing protein [Luteibacter sp. OK325]PTR33849.1 hypothetical protein C8J98_10234 [Luteibacter sp. OK325]